MLILGSHGFGAIVFVTALLVDDDITLVTANCAILTSLLVIRIVLLEHLVFAPVVRALDNRISTLSLMSFQVQVVNNFSASFVRVFTARLDLLELFGK